MYYLLEHAPHDESEHAAASLPEAYASRDDGTVAVAKDLVAPATATTTHTQPLTFMLTEPLGAPADYLKTDIGGGKLCTARFLAALRSLATSVHAYPAELRAPLGAIRAEATPYFFWVPPRLDGAIDWEQSEIWTNPELGVRQLTKLVLTAACLAAAPPVFRPGERWWREVLVHEHTRQVFVAHGVSGVRYLPLDVIADPLFAGPKVVALEQTVREQPDEARAWRDLGATRLLLLHQPADGLAALDRALQLSSADARAWEWRGVALKQLGRFEEALAAFRRAVELDPQNAAPLEWSSLLRQLGRVDEALAVAHAGVAAWPRHPRMWHQLGAAQAAVGAHAAALESFEHGMSAGGGPYEELLCDRSAALFHLGRLDEALAAYEQGLRFRPNHGEMWRGKAQVLRALGREAEAAEAEREADEAEGRKQWAAERIV